MYLSLGKAARELGDSPATVRRWTASGFLPCVRNAGGHRRIESDDVEELARAIGDSSHLEAQRARERELKTLVQASLDVASRPAPHVRDRLGARDVVARSAPSQACDVGENGSRRPCGAASESA